MAACIAVCSSDADSERTQHGVRILLVSPFDYGVAGGVNEHIAALDREFQRRGHDTRILAAASPNEGEGDDGHIHRIGLAYPLPSNGSRARIAISPMVTLRVRNFLASEPFDVIHAHEPLTPMLCLAALMHSRSATVGTFHASRPSNIMYHYTKAILDLFFEKIDVRVAVSEAARTFVDTYFPAEFEIVPNGIELLHYGADVLPLPELMDGRPNILFVGRFDEPRKGLRYLVQAMPLVRSQYPDARLIVVGEGESERYQRALEASGIHDTIWAGYVSHERKARYYASCDVFCAPSVARESFGIVLLEAMATGKPVVAAANEGYAAVINDGENGVLVPPRDEHALALAIVRVLADRDFRERISEGGLRRAGDFAWPVVAERLLDVYDRAMVARAAPVTRVWPTEIAGRRG